MTALIQRQFAVLSFITAFLFLMTGALALNNNKLMIASSTIQRAASHISSVALLTWMGREIPALNGTVQVDSTAGSVSGFLFQVATSIHPGDLRSLLGRELPGMITLDDSRFIVEGKGASLTDFYVEYPPHPRQVIDASPSIQDPPATDQTEGTQTGETTGEEKKPPSTVSPTPPKEKVVYVYTSHNRESWYSETKPNGASLDHPTRNISLVSRRLSEALNERGIGADVSTHDIYQQLVDKKKDYSLSYAESLQVLQAAKQEHRELHYFFDLHRDTVPRKESTATINGKTYARVLIVVGKRNKNHQQNEAFATELHKLMEEMYPELSRGVMEKGAKTDHGEYNQSISPGSLLLEIGGVENTLEESLNTAEALADVFAAYYLKAEKASTPAADEPKEG